MYVMPNWLPEQGIFRIYLAMFQFVSAYACDIRYNLAFHLPIRYFL